MQRIPWGRAYAYYAVGLVLAVDFEEDHYRVRAFWHAGADWRSPRWDTFTSTFAANYLVLECRSGPVWTTAT